MRRLLSDVSGGAALLFGIGCPVLIGMLALAVDTSWMFYNKGRLQTAADAAALGAVGIISNTNAALSRAVTLAAANVPSSFGTVTSNPDVQFGSYDATSKTFTVSNSNVNAVKVAAHRSVAGGNALPTFFGRIFGVTSAEASASAIAVKMGPSACFIVLEPSATEALSIRGGGKIQVPHCGVQVNSTSSNGAVTIGSSTATAKSFCFSGPSYGGSGFSPTPQTGCPAAADPLASVPEPSPPTCSINGFNSGAGATLTPNVTYCGNITLTGGGNFNMPPGTYYFRNASLSVGQRASLTGSGVTIYLDANSTLNINSSGSVNLSAPTSGTYQGILLFQSRNAPTSTVNQITGGPDVILDGTTYTPTAIMSMSGSGSLSNVAKSGYMISRVFTYNGSPTLEFDSYSGVVPAAFVGHPALVN